MRTEEIERLASMDEERVSTAIRLACKPLFGVLSNNFLCQSVGVLNPKRPVCVKEDETLENVVSLFSVHNISSILVVDSQGKLSGIFTERDCIRRGLDLLPENKQLAIRDLMTPDPVAELPEISVSYALNLMSTGGYRHIPLVDQDSIPVGVISVRDIVDYIVASFVDDLLNFKTEAV